MGSRNNKPARIVKGTAKQPTLKEASGIWTLDEALQAHRANAWPQPNLLQPIQKSLRLKGTGGNSYITKYPTRPGNRTNWTYSAWIKPGNIGGTFNLLDINVSGSTFTNLQLHTTGLIYYYDVISSTDYGYQTTAVYRDPSAWYHIVLAVDTTQSTAGNRAKLYVNGVQQTFSQNYGDYPTGFTTGVNATAGFQIKIGFNTDQSAYTNGYIGELNFIDGFQLDPSLFGQAGTDGVWIPKEYTGSHGTNGFYLPFITNTNSQTIGYDYSNFSTYDADQDPYRGNVSLHLTGNGPAGGNNNTYVDSSPSNLAITANVSNPPQGSFSPFAFEANTPYNPAIHGASIYQDGPYLTAPTAAVSSIGTGDFTVEGWWWAKSFGTDTLFRRLWSFGASLSNDVVLNVDTSGYLVYRNNDAPLLTSSNPLALNAWHHVAVVRSSGTTTVYINGVANGTTSTNNNLTSAGGNTFTLGGYAPNGSQGRWLGYISSFRIIKGSAVYKSSFIPPRRPFSTLTNNLIPSSEDFAGAGFWQTKSNSSIVVSSTVAPDGTPSASKLVESTANGQHWVGGSTSTTITSGNSYTFSVYLKAAERTAVQLYADAGSGYLQPAVFNLTTGAITNTGAGVTATALTNVGNGWYRASVTATAQATGTFYPYIGLWNSGQSYTGDGTSGIHIWGAQFETGSTLGDYTPTPENYSTAPSLLLNFANAAIVDSTGGNNAGTTTTATITASSKYGSGAMTFIPNNYLTIPNQNNFYFGTDNFTIECWYRSGGTQATYSTIISQDFTGSPATGAWKLANRSSSPQFTYGTGGGGLANVDAPSIVSLNDGAWHHYAVTRSSSTIRMFVDGVVVVSASIPITQVVGQASTDVYVGYNPRDSAYINGSVDDLRITKGVARYQDNFAPPNRALPEVGGKSFVTKNVTIGTVRSFTTVGTTAWTAPYDVNQVEVLVVAGGGGSGGAGGRSFTNSSSWSGGGGGGGVIYNSQYPVTPGQTYTVTVGAGGGLDSNGGNSVFGNLTAIGGGAGGDSRVSGDPGSDGGSGGGGGGDIATAGGAGTAGQGFAGGAGQDPSPEAGGGGGGAGAVGAAGSGTGAGGIGLQFGISGTPTYYAGGGGGGCGTTNKSTNTGGLGGGGNGSTLMYNNASNATAGTANTGGGGGGGPSVGGSGIVIVRYTTATEASHQSEDNLVDSPTLYGHDLQLGGEVVGNYATWNPLVNVSATFSNGNLRATPTTGNATPATIFVNTGKWYWEVSMDTLGGAGAASQRVGVVNTAGVAADLGGSANGWCFLGDGRTYNNGSTASYGSAVAANDILNVALDVDAGKIWYGKNGVWFASGAPAGGTSPSQTFTANQTMSPAVASGTGSPVYSANFGQRPFVYPAPAGYNALNTKNLPIPTGAAANPNQYFDAVLYTGTSSNVTVSNLNFQPDLIWVKARSNAQGHSLIDAVRGTSKLLQSNTTGAELTLTNLPTFNANGFTSTTDVHTNAYTYVAWCWKANGAAVSNTNGSITSQVSANTTSGFSIVSYTGTAASTVTIGHGLGVAPSFIILKNRDTVGNWYCYHSALGPTYRSSLNLTDTPFSPTGLWNSTAPSSTVFSTVQDGISFNNGSNHIAYCWSEVPGFSKFGSYTGNGSTDGPFVYLGFKPRYVLVKGVSNATDWNIIDTARDGVANTASNKDLITNATNAEASYGDFIWDFTSNGFKIRQISSAYNTAGNSYIYAAFAENPFKTSRAR